MNRTDEQLKEVDRAVGRMCSLLGWNMEKYNTTAFEAGMAFLHRYFPLMERRLSTDSKFHFWPAFMYQYRMRDVALIKLLDDTGADIDTELYARLKRLEWGALNTTIINNLRL